MQKTIYSKPYQELTKWLKESRENKSLTIRKLAKTMSVHHSIIWNIEHAQRRLDIVEYVDYCQQLEIDPVIGINIIKAFCIKPPAS